RGLGFMNMRRVVRSTFLGCLLGLTVMDAGARVFAESWKLSVLPSKIRLVGPHSRHGILVQRTESGDSTGLVTDDAQLSSSHPNVVVVRGRQVVPTGNGTARVRVRYDGQQAEVQVEVVDFQQSSQWSFRNHVQPILAKAGCKSGACHGALAGKGGFRLSLRGYDSQADHHTITRQARGRRIELGDPGRSLILAKPSGAISHKGGLRLELGSPNYRVVSEWIAAGAAGPSDRDPRLDRIEVLPDRLLLQTDTPQQVLVRAHYSNGHVEDVTRWCKFNSVNQRVAQVDDVGTVRLVGPGSGAVTAWFSSKIAISRLTAPYPNSIEVTTFQHIDARNVIDRLVLDQLRRLKLPPSPRCTDSEFLRRAHIDTIGTLPRPEEYRSFMADPAPDKRVRLTESLLNRPEFVDYWAYKWSDLLLISGQKLRPASVKAYYEWVHARVAENTPWDEFARMLITAQGSSHSNGVTNFYALHQDPESMTENVSQAFLGLSIGCARCHNHPLEKWTNDQYYAMANLFARVRAKGWGGDFRSGNGLRTLYVATKGDLIQPLTGKAQPPTPLDGQALDLNDPSDRRVHLANWLTAPENPYFSRTICNRVWANFFGVGLVESVDDMRASNPASNEPLLQALSEYLVRNQFDLKSLMRLMLQSETYHRSSQFLPENRAESRFYARYYPRRMMAEVMLDAISQVTGVPSDFNQIEFPGADKQKTDVYPRGTRALQLYDSAVASYFLKTFGRNQRQITCECERSDEPSMVQVLHLSNGDTINDKLSAKNGTVDKLLAKKQTDGQLIEDVFVMALSRLPTDAERKGLSQLFLDTDASDRRTLVEDLMWSVLTSREFLFNR
ncbi:MAG: DUF1549 and DUF1553 domain-containing protein, partial [Planctomycetaceae bacterium]